MNADVDPGFWQGRRVLVTGHTGFKGSWLSLWLNSMGAKVGGLALPPPSDPSLFDLARLSEVVDHAVGDVRDFEVVKARVAGFRPDVIIHLAAQPLVRFSYHEPALTYATNVMGTLHVLEAARQLDCVRAIVNVTTDKCYENQEWEWGYREVEPMGGDDPYSSSKACSELVSSAYRTSFMKQAGIALATARAGNVIGGGDWAEDRLIPDILRALGRKEVVKIRMPSATRPWQHVLEPSSGYLVLAQALVNHGETFEEAWNFGPEDSSVQPVRWLVDRLCTAWGDGAAWEEERQDELHEANFFKLDISKARRRLGWAPRWSIEETISRIVGWQRGWLRNEDVRDLTLAEIAQYQRR